ncbi:MAG: hypothetical protein JOY61_05320, partial [Chloroflexi bacterium]|nr:hypothetical protein [Chloroflexota bacterium]
MSRRAFLTVAALALGAGAGLAIRGTSSTGSAVDQRLVLGDLVLAINADPWRMSVFGPSSELVLQEAADQTIGYVTPDGRSFHARRLSSAEATGPGQVQLIVESDDPAGAALAIQITQLDQRTFRMTITPDSAAGVAAVTGAFDSAPTEHFLGMGERFDSADQRGKVVEVWAEDRRVAGYGPSTYAPLPRVLSSAGYSFTLERFERSRFDFAASQADRWSWQQQADSATLTFNYGTSLKDLVQSNAQRTGLPPLPPMWAFGVWKTSVGGSGVVIDEMMRLRRLKVPISGVFAFDAVDSEANIGWPYVTFAGRQAGKYPDPASFTSTLHGLGLKVLNYFTADFHLDRPNYQEPAVHGFLVQRQDGRVYVHPEFQVAWLDLADPDAAAWWTAGWRRAMTDLGYDGGMLDLGELIPPDAVLGDGSTGLQSHNRYPLLYARAAWESASTVRPDGDFVLLLRSGAIGAQRYQSGQWNGDAVMRWQSPDGLQSMVPAAVSFGLSGFPFWHAEVAGYVQSDLSHDQERELWLRWLQLATWTSLLRDHLGDHQRSPIDVWLDEGTTEAFRVASRVHASLLPYLYSLALEASQSGLPLLRHMALEAPDDPRAWSEDRSYFLGPTFLVAPVLEAGATERTVYLPQGEWV